MEKINRYFLQGTIPVPSDADVTMFAVPFTGDIVNMRLTNEVALTTADEDLTLSTVVAAGTTTVAVVGGVMTIATGTNLFVTSTLTVAQVATTRVTAGDSIHLANDGACTSAGRGFITIEIKLL